MVLGQRSAAGSIDLQANLLVNNKRPRLYLHDMKPQAAQLFLRVDDARAIAVRILNPALVTLLTACRASSPAVRRGD